MPHHLEVFQNSNVKSSSWRIWLPHYRLLSSHCYRTWAPSSSTLNTMTNICHVLFAFTFSPLGKMHVQWRAQFWSGFSVWDWFDFFKTDAFFWITVRKGKMEETRVALGVACRNVCSSLHVRVCGGVQLYQTNLEGLLTVLGFFCGREAELDFPESQEQMCSLLDCGKWSCSSLEPSHKLGTAPQNKAACPCHSRGWRERLLLETAVWEL